MLLLLENGIISGFSSGLSSGFSSMVRKESVIHLLGLGLGHGKVTRHLDELLDAVGKGAQVF